MPFFAYGLRAFTGTNVFTVDNLSGATTCSSICSLSDFPVVTSLTFESLAVGVSIGAATETVDLSSTLAPGSMSPNSLEFDASTQIESATLSGSVDQTRLTLQDGTVYSVNPNSLSVLLLPSNGDYLQDGDLAIPSIQGSLVAASTPAPFTS